MTFSTQQNFTAELDGVTIRDLTNKLDYSLTTYKDRLELVKSILSGTKFFEMYFSDYFKANINTREVLSSNVNVCKALERFTDYILNSKELKQQEDGEKTKYIFHTDPNYFQKKLDRELKVSQIAPNENGSDKSEENVIHFIKREHGNSKKPKVQKILPQDLNKENECGRILTEYNQFLQLVTEELKKKDKSKYSRFLLTKTKGELFNDMVYTKDHLNGVFGYDLKGFNESSILFLDVFDFTNKRHLLGGKVETESGKILQAKGLLYFKRTYDPNSEWDLILMELQKTIDKANLTEKELLTLDMMRQGLRHGEIAQELNIHHQEISRLIDRIAVKVTKVGNKYDGEKSL